MPLGEQTPGLNKGLEEVATPCQGEVLMPADCRFPPITGQKQSLTAFGTTM